MLPQSLIISELVIWTYSFDCCSEREFIHMSRWTIGKVRRELPPPSPRSKHSIVSSTHWEISECGYDHAQRVWKAFGMKHLGDYHYLYLKTDVLLLCNVFETFRTTCLEHCALDCAHFYTSPGLAWQAFLKKTEVSLGSSLTPTCY